MHSIPFIIAHRGASAYAPENTMAAFKKAADMGVTCLEFDVQLAACGEAVIIHDHTLNRTTNGKGKVANKTYAQLLELDAGSWFSDEFSGEKIPCLTEVINFLGKQKMTANIELKPDSGQEQGVAKAVVDAVQQFWTKHSAPPIVSSYSVECLTTVRELNAQIPIGLLLEQWDERVFDLAAQLQGCSIHIEDQYLTEDIVKAVKQQGYLALSYTVNDTNRVQLLKKWGIDAVFTDYPDIISAAIIDSGE